MFDGIYSAISPSLVTTLKLSHLIPISQALQQRDGLCQYATGTRLHLVPDLLPKLRPRWTHLGVAVASTEAALARTSDLGDKPGFSA